MNKIPTIFQRDDGFRVVDEWTPGCEWVRDGEGAATEKLDGTNVRVTHAFPGDPYPLEKRRNPTREEKAAGAEPGYVPAVRDDPGDKHIWRAFDATEMDHWGVGSWVCEAIGPKIQGNPLALEAPVLVRLVDAPRYEDLPRAGEIRTFDALRGLFSDGLLSLYAFPARAEGIVFHHPDGRMAKIKAKDFR